MTDHTFSAGLTAEAYAEKLFNASIATFETLSVYAGDRLGWYRSLADDGPATAAELAARTGTQERYCREWLEMQASFGTLTVERGATRGDNRFTLPAGPAEVLTDRAQPVLSGRAAAARRRHRSPAAQPAPGLPPGRRRELGGVRRRRP